MNKFFALKFVIFLVLTGCSKDGNSKIENSLVGTWERHRIVVKCDENNSEVTEYTECQKMGLLIFSSEGRYDLTEYTQSGINNECRFKGNKSGPYSIENENLRLTGESIYTYFELVSNDILRIGHYYSESRQITCSDNSPAEFVYYQYQRI